MKKDFEKTAQQFDTQIEPLEIGTMFCHYHVQKELGRGGMGVVYQVNDTKLNRKVALKVIFSNIESQQTKRFLQEAKAIAGLNHSNIVQVFDFGNTPQHYFTMEHIEGETLSFYIKNETLLASKIAFIFCKIAKALAIVHKQGIIHRDLKPGNIMINRNGEPKIMDFGLVKVIDSELSKTGEIMGTPAYMSPEQTQGEKIDARSDIYSLGATLYKTLVKRTPFQGSQLWIK